MYKEIHLLQGLLGNKDKKKGNITLISHLLLITFLQLKKWICSELKMLINMDYWVFRNSAG